jgi:hypothetical protein
MRKPERRSAEGSISGRANAAGDGPEPPRLPASHAADAWRYVAVAFPSPRQPGETGGPELGILVRNQPDIVRWGPDYPPTLLPPGHIVLKQYAAGPSDPCRAAWQRTQLQFARDFPPRAVPPCAAPGWLAPDGRFYACRWLEHDRLGYRLAAAHYGDPCGPLTLEQRGWLRVQHDGTIVRLPSARLPSQAQLDVLFTLLEVSQGVYRANIREQLELACVLAALYM